MVAAATWAQHNSMQTLIVSYTMYVDSIACYEASETAIWFKKFVSSVKVVDTISKSPKLHYDNGSIIYYSNKNKSSDTTKHIGSKYYDIKGVSA